MAVAVYKAMKYRCLAGKKIYRNGNWITLPDTAKMYLNGAWHDLAFSGPLNPVIVPAQTLTHENGAEPAAGTQWYITPSGRGNKDGSSWANAAPGSAVYAVLLSCSSGDSVYFSEGDYSTDRTLVLPSGVNLYGGFVSGNEVWATRNGFAHQSIFTGTGTFGWMDGAAAVSGQIVDGFVISNYNSTITGNNAVLRNSIVTLGTASLRTAYNCVFVSAASTIYDAEKCNFFYASCSVTHSATCVHVVGTDSSRVPTYLYHAQNSTVTYGCASSIGGLDASIFVGEAHNCAAVNCRLQNGNHSVSLFNYDAYNCTAVNCEGANIAILFCSTSENCTAVNCTAFRIFSTAYNSVAVNCTRVSTSVAGEIFSSGVFCTAANCSNASCFSQGAKNCIAWNNGSGFSSPASGIQKNTCAGSAYEPDLALVLGTDNSIARFIDTGYFPARGVQDVGDCPDPILDPTGYAAYLAAFGDWHPAADSFLVGRGTADQNVTTDADGVTRPDPPTIGAYEPRPNNGGE